MPKGGTLRIGSRAFPMPDGQPGVAITVADTGVRIARDIQKRVFEPFVTTKSVGRGTGLGLAQVYGFARGAGGDAKVDSQPGHGTRITLLLPAANGQAALDATAHRRLVGTSIAAVSEEASGILSGDAIEGGSQRLLQRLDRARGDPAQISFHFGPSGFDRAEVRAVGGQIAIGKA